MKILIANHFYHPVVGGSVILTDGIAAALLDLGHEVKVTTKRPGGPKDAPIVPVQREPSFLELCEWMRWSDGVIIIEPSITYCTAAWISRRPSAASLQTWYSTGTNKANFNGRVRRLAGNIFSQITSPSNVLAKNWCGNYPIVPNGFESEIFFNQHLPRIYDFVFLGRFIEDKGPDLFIKALIRMHHAGHEFRALLVGDGELLEECKKMVEVIDGLPSKFNFAGEIRDRTQIASLLNQCQVLVMPNRWDEPFGMVALEGLSCGTRLVVTNSGALPEVAGEYAEVVEKEDLPALTEAMNRAIQAPSHDEVKLGEHLRQFQWNQIAKLYLSVLASQKD